MGRIFDISGSWRGFYEQAGSRHGISMTVAQRGRSIVGRMRDDDTVMTTATPEKLILGPEDGDGDATDRSAAHDVERTVLLETIATLPEHSVVEGDVFDDQVVFEKRYLGPHQISTWIDGRAEAHYALDDHRVRYQGALDASGALLTGQWLIGPADAPQLTGVFELRREDMVVLH